MARFLVTVKTPQPVEAESHGDALNKFLADTSKASCSISAVPHRFRSTGDGRFCDYCHEIDGHDYHATTPAAAVPGEGDSR